VTEGSGEEVQEHKHIVSTCFERFPSNLVSQHRLHHNLNLLLIGAIFIEAIEKKE
jgi:hypothetical protein